mgnify:CR=1 FL=1
MENKSKKILAEISPGELMDKISILEIKLSKIKDKNTHDAINKEYQILLKTKNINVKSTDNIKKLFTQIKKINLDLWNIEDKIRLCEKNKDFSQTFIALARDVYFTNDKRSKVKSEINKALASDINEIKQYIKY